MAESSADRNPWMRSRAAGARWIDMALIVAGAAPVNCMAHIGSMSRDSRHDHGECCAGPGGQGGRRWRSHGSRLGAHAARLQGRAELRQRQRRLLLRPDPGGRSEEHTSELQSLMRISYAVFCLKKKTKTKQDNNT